MYHPVSVYRAFKINDIHVHVYKHVHVCADIVSKQCCVLLVVCAFGAIPMIYMYKCTCGTCRFIVCNGES